MADSVAFKPLTVQSHRGPYAVSFEEGVPSWLRGGAVPPGAAEGDAMAYSGHGTVREELHLAHGAMGVAHYLIDAKVAKLFPEELAAALRSPSVLAIEAAEPNKSLEAMPRYVRHLLANRVRRGDCLVAVGGGIVQDIACFLAATMLRGLDWHFVPTTLLAQADSCIGSKSSINAGEAKNILGTFTPPKTVSISARFLDTLEKRDVQSGIGEMLKAHAIEGPQSFDRIAADYGRIFESRETMLDYIRRSLEIKRKIVEADEFDRGPRLVMNYGHTFGHAIESATEFAVPHGIAITMGMDMANFLAVLLERMDKGQYARMHRVLAANYMGFEKQEIPLEALLSAIAKDKKNTKAQIGLILPDASVRLARVYVAADDAFRRACEDYLRQGRLP